MHRLRAQQVEATRSCDDARGLLISVVLGVLSAACGSEAPVGPGTVTVTQTTSTTTTTSTSTSTVAPSLTASFTVSPTTAPTGQQVMVNGSASFAAPGRRIVGFEWDYGDGTKKSGVTSSHDYDVPGTFPIILDRHRRCRAEGDGDAVGDDYASAAGVERAIPVRGRRSRRSARAGGFDAAVPVAVRGRGAVLVPVHGRAASGRWPIRAARSPRDRPTSEPTRPVASSRDSSSARWRRRSTGNSRAA